jgi:hypothetical protein
MTVKELKAFIAVKLYMGLKKLPQVRFYWMKSEPFCIVISLHNYFHRTGFTSYADVCISQIQLTYAKTVPPLIMTR